ncbi:hypothetical protein MF621_004045 (plasmid) [Bacillus velezensis]|uniref:hypothetical protein n=1 Tax=Bacillus velezensis TaxID=492670 RepID=UPI0020252A49|nr:hypothetical protein [Bacillus velezensis]URJ76339.1 hypothetical protein MF619_004083 [Bacillus velezensis]URJ80459.1 hypothetical protein MF621_004045 [Bacillus velezensis]
MSISQLINVMYNNQVAKAMFCGEIWHVTKSKGSIKYCDDITGLEIGEIISLTPRNLKAEYEIVEVE